LGIFSQEALVAVRTTHTHAYIVCLLLCVFFSLSDLVASFFTERCDNVARLGSIGTDIFLESLLENHELHYYSIRCLSVAFRYCYLNWCWWHGGLLILIDWI